MGISAYRNASRTSDVNSSSLGALQKVPSNALHSGLFDSAYQEVRQCCGNQRPAGKIIWIRSATSSPYLCSSRTEATATAHLYDRLFCPMPITHPKPILLVVEETLETQVGGVFRRVIFDESLLTTPHLIVQAWPRSRCRIRTLAPIETYLQDVSRFPQRHCIE